MFDNPIDDAVPGKPTICGWPWHGRLDMPSALGAIPELTLKNGQVIPLAISLGKPERREWHQHGTVLRFRDPRAVDPIRTPAELAADEARGVSWRADVLYAPREGVLYGQAPKEGRLQTWLYHDGERNWRVRFQSNNSLLLRSQLIVVGRKRPVIAQQVVSVTYPDGVPYMPMMVIIDATPTGDRVLFARHVDEEPDGSNLYEDGSPRVSYNQDEFGAWASRPRDFWELTLVNNGPNSGISAVFRIVRTEEKVWPAWFDYSTERVGDGAVYATVEYGVGTTTTTTYWGSTVPPVDIWNPVGPLIAWGGSNYWRRHTHIAGLYYEGGEIKEIAVKIEGRSEYRETMGGISFSVDYEGTWQPEFVPGSASLTATYSRSTNLWVTATLLRDGAQISQVTATSSAAATQGVRYDCGISRLAVSATRTTPINTMTHRTGFSFDGVAVPSQTRVLQDNVGISFYRQRTEIAAVASISVVRYSANMIALAVNLWADDGDLSNYYRRIVGQYIGNCATPGGAVPTINAGPRLPPLGHLFGSWNPVTKESIRDALNPVFWV